MCARVHNGVVVSGRGNPESLEAITCDSSLKTLPETHAVCPCYIDYSCP